MPSQILPDTMRLLVRHQWVRENGTPRITALAGPPAKGRSLWLEWLSLSGRPPDATSLLVQPARAARDWLARAAGEAAELAERAPARPVAIAAHADLLRVWLDSRGDRAAALIAEGMIEIGRAGRTVRVAEGAGAIERTGAVRAPGDLGRARSLAELTLFEALQATPGTAGRFQLNQEVSVHFGDRAAEVDLLSRADRLAVEIDGHFHFADLDHYRRDRRKDALLQAHGYVVLRLLAADVLADPRAAVRSVMEMLALRSGVRS